ncbi:MAG: energy transducer TonB [Gammaproteobacteria bacterium]|nr:energy transducer TonB [Gammaproteobacteria bacterium]
MRVLPIIGLLFLSGCSSKADTTARVAPVLENEVSAYGCKKPPQFPVSAIIKKIEGWAVVEFTLDDDGYPSNMKVIDSSPEGYFERAAMDSLSSCKYRKEQGVGPEHKYTSTLAFKYS